MKKLIKIMMVSILVIVTGFSTIACGNNENPAAFVGRWELVRGDFPFERAELFKDGTGVVSEGGFSWKVIDKRLVITHPMFAIACDYEINEIFITLTTDDGNKGLFVNNSADRSKLSISNNLIGKWEYQKIITGDAEFTFPTEYGEYAGIHFTKEGFTMYNDGYSWWDFQPAFTKGNKLYGPADILYGNVSEWNVSNDVLTIKESVDGEITTVTAKKVQRFSWE